MLTSDQPCPSIVQLAAWLSDVYRLVGICTGVPEPVLVNTESAMEPLLLQPNKGLHCASVNSSYCLPVIGRAKTLQDVPSSVLNPFSYEPMALRPLKSPPCCHAFPASMSESTMTASHSSGELPLVCRTTETISSSSSALTWVYVEDDRRAAGGLLDDIVTDSVVQGA